MKIIHLSDTHGLFTALPLQGELVIHSGDLIPNFGERTRKEEEAAQIRWIERNVYKISRRLGRRAILYCGGDHDLIDPCPFLRTYGVRAYNVTNTVVDMRGFLFSGLPLVPWLQGEWDHERKPNELEAQTEAWHDQLAAHKRKPQQRTIVIAHCPPNGLCDTIGPHHEGNPALRALIDTPRFQGLAAVFCGHIHEDFGFATVGDVLVSNAATTVHVVDVGEAGVPVS